MIDLLQMLILENHNAYLHLEWSNIIEFKDANESVRTIALHSTSLHSAVENLALDYNSIKLRGDRGHIAKSIIIH